MSIKKYCDICEKELEKKDELIHDGQVGFEVIRVKDIFKGKTLCDMCVKISLTKDENEHYCKACILDIINKGFIDES